MTKLIIKSPLFRIAQNFIGFGGFFKFVFGGFIAWIPIRMVFLGEFAVRCF